MVYGATAGGQRLCCDATLADTLVPSVACDGSAVPLATVRRRKGAGYPKLACSGPPRLCALAAEVAGRWNNDSAAQAWCVGRVGRRGAAGSLQCRGGKWTMPALLVADAALPMLLVDVLALAEAAGPSRLPLRGARCRTPPQRLRLGRT